MKNDADGRSDPAVDRNDEQRRRVVVTGATGGIGAAIVATAAARGDQVLAIGRSAELLRSLFAALPTVTPIVADLLDADGLPATLTSVGHVDALIHCAAVADVSGVADMPAGGWRRTFDVNVSSAAELTQVLLDGLRRAQGHVVFVNASPGMRAVPRWSAYVASKAAQRELADSLRAEEEENGIRVTTVYPGAVATPLLRKVRAAFGRPYEGSRMLSPDSLASVIMTILDQSPDVHLTEVSVRAAYGRP